MMAALRTRISGDQSHLSYSYRNNNHRLLQHINGKHFQDYSEW